MLEYLQLLLTGAVLVLLTPVAVDYLKFKLVYAKNYKLLVNKMDDLKLPSTNSTSHTELLSLIAASGESKKYFGKETTVRDIVEMSPNDQEKLLQRYEAKFGHEVIKTVGNSLSSIYARCLGLATPVQVLGFNVNLASEQALADDLNNDPVIQTTLAHQLGKIWCAYGTLLAPLVAMLITAKNMDINKQPKQNKQNRTVLINGRNPTQSNSRASQPGTDQGDEDRIQGEKP